MYPVPDALRDHHEDQPPAGAGDHRRHDAQRIIEFWSKYSERLIGNWITYDTPLKDICAFAERVYLRRDFTGFKGDRKFVRDDGRPEELSPNCAAPSAGFMPGA